VLITSQTTPPPARADCLYGSMTGKAAGTDLIRIAHLWPSAYFFLHFSFSLLHMISISAHANFALESRSAYQLHACADARTPRWREVTLLRCCALALPLTRTHTFLFFLSLLSVLLPLNASMTSYTQYTTPPPPAATQVSFSHARSNERTRELLTLAGFGRVDVEREPLGLLPTFVAYKV
jgi:hypothetical protein